MKESYGAAVERGIITALTEKGARVESLDRDGIQTPPLPFWPGFEAEEGAKVYFFMFGDGTGMILPKISQ